MSQDLTKEQVIKRLDGIVEKRGKGNPYSDSGLDEVKTLCKYINEFPNLNLKDYFKGHKFTYAMYRDMKKRYLQDNKPVRAAVPKESRPAPPPKTDETPKPKTVKPKTGRPLSDVKRVRIATYIDEDLNKKLRIYGAINELKLNDMIEDALNEYFKNKSFEINI